MGNTIELGVQAGQCLVFAYCQFWHRKQWNCQLVANSIVLQLNIKLCFWKHFKQENDKQDRGLYLISTALFYSLTSFFSVSIFYNNMAPQLVDELYLLQLNRISKYVSENVLGEK